MNYTASVSDYFKSPKWMMNTLLAGICVFIPFVGQIVIKGWLITGFWGREDERPEAFPDFDFNNFAKYLERGLWPFLVSLVSGLVIATAACVIIVPSTMILGLMTPNNHSPASGCAGALFFLAHAQAKNGFDPGVKSTFATELKKVPSLEKLRAPSITPGSLPCVPQSVRFLVPTASTRSPLGSSIR